MLHIIIRKNKVYIKYSLIFLTNRLIQKKKKQKGKQSLKFCLIPTQLHVGVTYLVHYFTVARHLSH